MNPAEPGPGRAERLGTVGRFQGPAQMASPVLGSELTDLRRLQQQLLLQLVGGKRVLQQLDLQP